jgi:hypothetical protein
MNDYQLVKEIVSGMNIGEIKTVKPDNVLVFRKYLTEQGQKNQKTFRTKKENGNLLVKRIKKEKIW